MANYIFEAMDATGRELKDIMEAESEDMAMENIRRMGYFVTKIRLADDNVVVKKQITGHKRFWYKLFIAGTCPIWIPLVALFAFAFFICIGIKETFKRFWRWLDSILDLFGV